MPGNPTNPDLFGRVAKNHPLCSNALVKPVNLILATFLLGSSSVSTADVVPTLSTKSLVDRADLIVVGKIERVQENGTGNITFSGVNYASQDYAADISVDETVKGDPVPRRFVFTFSVPSADEWGNVARGSLLPSTYRVIFLNKTAAGYRFTSPYSPSIPASPKPCGPDWQVQLGEDAYHKVLQRLLNLLCTDSSSESKQSALFVLNWNEDSSAAPFLKAALNLTGVRSNPILRMSIVSDLLHWKDSSVLALAEADLFDQSVQSPFFPKSNLVLAMSSLDPQISIPMLARVLKLPQPEERVAAARFLEYTNSQAALDVLLFALDDPDRQVQFAVMQSLGNLTNQHQWRPNSIDSDSLWEAYIKHWREFEKQTKAAAQ
jgi:hypothetical protein